MLKTSMTVLVTAAVCFAVAATTGFAAQAKRVIKLVPGGDVVILQNGNVQCQALDKTTLACGANKLPGAVHVYFSPHQVNVIKFNAAGTKYSVLWSAKR